MLPIARIFLLLGVAFLIMGGLFLLFDRLGVSLGRLPGDIKVEGSNFTCLIGLGTSIVLSILLTVVLNLLLRFLGK